MFGVSAWTGLSALGTGSYQPIGVIYQTTQMRASRADMTDPRKLLRGTFLWQTTDPWPTTLPGTTA